MMNVRKYIGGQTNINVGWHSEEVSVANERRDETYLQKIKKDEINWNQKKIWTEEFEEWTCIVLVCVKAIQNNVEFKKM